MQATAEEALSAKNPATRQVLVNIGNRYVVFGTNNTLPGRRIIGPEDVVHRFSTRVGDEYEFPHNRLVDSLQVDGASIKHADISSDHGWDIEIELPDKTRVLVEVKVRTRKFSMRDMERHLDWIKSLQARSRCSVEVWNFNIERLNLTILSADSEGIPNFTELEPLNVWEFNEDGGVFDRARVVARIADWEARISGVYNDVRAWADGLGYDIDTSRTVQMSEEIMQKFAIPDRDLPILDVSKQGQSILSFVPVGLWVFGSNGRIDLITQGGTKLLIDIAKPMLPPEWKVLIDRSARSFDDWTSESFLQILNGNEAA